MLFLSSLCIIEVQGQQDYHLVYTQDYESSQAIRDFEMSDQDAWKISQNQNSNQTQEIYGKSDDLGEAIMEASDIHFTDGAIRFGSFDDTGRFDNIKMWAPNNKIKKSGFFR